jgi:hypothetical protein
MDKLMLIERNGWSSPPIYRGGNFMSANEASAFHQACINRESGSRHRNLTRTSQYLFGGTSVIPRVIFTDIIEPFVAGPQVLGNPVVFQEW